MKTLISLFVIISTQVFSQGSLKTTTGFIQFDATSQNFEQIIAKNNQVKSEFEPQSGFLECLVLVKNFVFKLPLMQEHFNNHYLETDTYPKAYFKGKIIGYDPLKVTEKATEFDLKGSLILHGKSKKITTKISVKKSLDKYILETNFDVLLNDFEIKIPKTLSNQIAEKSNIKVKLEFKTAE